MMSEDTRFEEDLFTACQAGEYFVKRIEGYYLIRLASLFGVAGCLGKGGTKASYPWSEVLKAYLE